MNMMFPKPTKQKKRKKHKKSIMQPKGDRRCYLCMLLDGDFTYKPYLEEHHVLFGNTHAFAEAEAHGGAKRESGTKEKSKPVETPIG